MTTEQRAREAAGLCEAMCYERGVHPDRVPSEDEFLEVIAPALAASEAEVARLQAENDKLREAVRKFAVSHYEYRHLADGSEVSIKRCYECGARGILGDPEPHALGCLAAPDNQGGE
jgi:hypothetical protein